MAMSRVFSPGAHIRRAALAAALTLTLTSCGGGREAAPQPAQSPQSPEAARAAPQAPGPQWPRAESIDTSARTALPQAVAGRLQESPVPVLVPGDSRLLQRSEAVVVANQYTVTSKVDDSTFSIQASPAQAGRTERSSAIKRTPVGGRAVFFTENEGIRVATWIENGVAYSAEIECAKADDPKCRDNTYLQSMIEKLVFVGGKGARTP
jgi:hypothetical protein